MRTSGEFVIKVFVLLLGQGVLGHGVQRDIGRALEKRDINADSIGKNQQLAEQYKDLQNEYELYRKVCEERLKEYYRFQDLLEEEKRNRDDIQFRYEEQLLTKSDLQAALESQLELIKQIELKLGNQLRRTEVLQTRNDQLQQENSNLGLVQTRFSRNVDEEQKEIAELKAKLETFTKKLENQEKEIEKREIENKVTTEENNKLYDEKDRKIQDLQQQLTSMVKDKIQSEKENEEKLHKVNMLLTSKSHDLEIALHKQKQLEVENIRLNKVNAALQNDCKIENDEQTEKMESDLKKTKTSLEITNKELLKVKKECALRTTETDKEARVKGAQLDIAMKEINRLEDELNQTISQMAQNTKTRHTRQISKMESQHMYLSEVSTSLQNISEELNVCQMLNTHLEHEICSKNDIIEKLKMEMHSFSLTYNEQHRYIMKMVEELQEAQLKAGAWERKYQVAEQTIIQLQKLKKELELQIQTMLGNSQDSSEQLQSLNEQIRRLEQSLESLQTEMNEKLEAAARVEQDLRLTLQRTQEQYNIEKHHLEEQLTACRESESLTRGTCDKSIREAHAAQEQLKQEIIELQRILEQHKELLSKQEYNYNEQIRVLSEKLEMTISEHERVLNEINNSLEGYKAERTELEAIIKQKTNMLVELEEKLRQHLLDSDNISKQEKMAFEQQIHNLYEEINHYKSIIEQNTAKLNEYEHRITEFTNIKYQLEVKLQEKEQHLKQINDAHAQCESMYNEINTVLTQTKEQVTVLQNQITQLTVEKNNIQNTVMHYEQQITELNEKVEHLTVQIQQYVVSVEEKERQISYMNVEITKLQQHKSSIDLVLQERENKIVALIEQLEVVQKERGTTSEIFKTQEAKILELNMEIQRITQEKIEINNVIMQKESIIAEMTQQVEHYRSEVQVIIENKEREMQIIREQLESVRVEKERIVEMIHEKEETLIILNNEIGQLKNEKVILERTVEEHQRNFAEVKEELRQNGDCRQAQTVVVSELEHTIQEKQQTIVILQEEIHKLREQWEKPVNNPVVKEIYIELQEKSKELEQKENEIIVLKTEVQAIEQQQMQLQHTWQHSIEEWKKKYQEVVEIKQENHQQCENLQQQIIVLQGEANQVHKIENDLQQERTKLNELYQQLTISEQQRVDLVNKLEIIVSSGQQQQECKPVVQIVKEIQQQPAIEVEAFYKQVQEDRVHIEESLKETKILLIEKEQELAEQRNQCSTLQKQLLQMETKIVEVPVPVPGPVRYIGCEQQKPVIDLPHDVNVEFNKASDSSVIVQVPTNPIPTIPTIPTINWGKTAETQANVIIQPQPTPKPIIHEVVKYVRVPAPYPVYVNVPQPTPQVQQPQIHLIREQQKQEQVQMDHEHIYTHPEIIQTMPKQPIYIEQDRFQNIYRPQTEYFIPQKPTVVVKPLPVHVHVPNQSSVEATAYAEAKASAEAKVTADAGNISYKPNVFVPGQVKVEASAQCDALATSYQKVFDENIMCQTQLQYLNSIIADMHKQNEMLKMQIQTLEVGCSAQAQASSMAEVNVKRVIPPRRYCDICEIFDAHETEDCPIQMSDTQVENIINKINAEPRPYCDICEEFGHDTSDCNANETY